MRTRKETHQDSKEHHNKMAVTIMIQAQATQIEHKTVEEYLSEKYGIGSVADGQRKKTD